MTWIISKKNVKISVSSKNIKYQKKSKLKIYKSAY